MGRSSPQGLLGLRLFTCSALILVLAAAQGAAAAAPAADRGECRRFTTCVPENPCHTGWVTGCRKNVPICTDIGGWLDNGASCGDDAVCHLGQCVACAAGDPCPVKDASGTPLACRAGVIACGSGQPVCLEVGSAPDGEPCPWGVCMGGQCQWCSPGSQCWPAEDPCHFGEVSCTGGVSCVPTAQPVPDGWGCGPDRYCQGGECLQCVWGAACTIPELPCWAGQTACWSGPQCQPATPLDDGSPCPGGLCSAGTCNPCGAGASCASPTPCRAEGQLSCATGLCEPAGAALPDGTGCGLAGETCTAGLCGGVTGARLVVRTASGAPLDLTGTSWTQCHPDEPAPGMSRRAIDAFGPGTFTHSDLVFPASSDCTGESDPALGLVATAQTTSAGDRLVGWTEGAPPWVPPTVSATAVLLSGIDPGTGLPGELRMLWFVNDLGWPPTLHEGDKDLRAEDGYPGRLLTGGRPKAPTCEAGAPCQGPGSTCRSWAIDCGSGTPVCAPRAPAADGTPCGAAGETCAAGACVGAAGAPLVVRTASGGATDLTGTTWTTCFPGEPEPWTSRWTSDRFAVGGLTHSEEVYVASLDCTGPTDPARSWTATAAAETAGDRWVGWTNGSPPVWGLPNVVVATGVVISGTDPETGVPFSFQDLAFVDDVFEWPRGLYAGNGEGPRDPDGFPAQLANQPALEPASGRTVTGTRWLQLWTEAGPAEAFPLLYDAVSAIVPDGAGGQIVRPGLVMTDGTFSIPGVPDGPYLLRLDAGGVAYLAETDAASLDMGVDTLGRAGLAWGWNVPLDFTATGLDPWTPGDLVEAYSVGANVACLPLGDPAQAAVPEGATQATATLTLPSTPLPGAPDTVIVFQGRYAPLAPGASYVAASSAGTVLDPTLVAAGPNAWSATLAPIAEQGTFRSTWPAPLYEAHVAEMGPGATVLNQKIGVTAAARPEPFVPAFRGTYMATTGPAVLIARAGPGFGGVELLELPYGRFLQWPWTEYRDVRMSATVRLAAGGSTVTVRPSIGRIEPLATAPLDAAPLVSPPRDLQVNGVPATAALAGVGTGPTLSWSPPAVGAPTAYLVRVSALPSMALVASARTAGTSLRLPDGLLAPGTAYFAWVTARLSPGDRPDAPLRRTFAGASADAVTAPFTP